MLLRLGVALALLALGAAHGVATVASHELWWGLPLATGGLAALFVAVGRGWHTRLALALGFVAVVGAALQPGAAGGYAVSSNTRGYLLLGLAFVVLVTAVVTLPRPTRRPRGAAGSGSVGSATYDGAHDRPGT